MEGGSGSKSPERANTQRGQKLGSVLPKVEPFVPRKGYDPKELRSWAKRTGFVSNSSGESSISVSERGRSENIKITEFDLEKGLDRNGSSSPTIEIDPVLGRTRNRGIEIKPVSVPRNGNGGVLGLKNGRVGGESERKREKIEAEPDLGAKVEERKVGFNGNLNEVVNGAEQKREDGNVGSDFRIEVYPEGGELGHGGWSGSSKMKFGPRENPGFEGHCHCNFHNAVGFWHYHNTALILWYPSSVGSREFICVFGTSISYYKLRGVSESHCT